MLWPSSKYFYRITKARYFWIHLVLSDLRLKYRRSFLGIAWSILHPVCLTLLLGFVMSRFFNSSLGDYAPFILSGLIFWEFIFTSAVNGCHAFLNAEGYIRQFAHPLAIYSLRSTLGSFINLCVAFVGLLIWVLFWKPSNCCAAWFSLPISFLLLFLIGWPLSTITAIITVRFRDFSQMISLMLQAVWYISPIFFLPSLFERAEISWVMNSNPIYHILCLFRAPLLQREFPTLLNFAYCLGTAMILGIGALLLLKISEKKVIFYL